MGITRRVGVTNMAIRDIYPRLDEEDQAPPLQPRAATALARSTGIFAILWRRKMLIGLMMLLCIAAGVGYIAVTPSRYLASTAILIDPRLGKTVGSDPVQPGFIVDTSAIDSQIKLFTSQTVLERVAKKADLADDPEFNGSKRGLLQTLLRPTISMEGGVDLKALEDAITIKRPERTYVVTIEVLSNNAKKSADLANDLTQAYIDDQVGARNDAARDDTDFVRQRLDKLSGQIKDAETKVEAFKSQNNIVDSTGLRSNEQQVGDLTKALGDARAKASDARAHYDEIRKMARRGRLDASSEALRSPTIERLRQAQAETDQAVAKLATTLGAQHPELIEARGRQAKLDGLIKAELGRVELSAQSDSEATRKNEAQILSEVDRIKNQSTTMSRNLVPLDQLERNVKVLRASFDRLASVNDNLLQQQGETPPGRVISVARPSVSPAQPKKTVIALVSLSAGVFLGLAAALLAESAASGRPRVPDVVYEPQPLETPRDPKQGQRRRYWDDEPDDGKA